MIRTEEGRRFFQVFYFLLYDDSVVLLLIDLITVLPFRLTSKILIEPAGAKRIISAWRAAIVYKQQQLLGSQVPSVQ